MSGKNATPFPQQTVVLTKQDYIALKGEANYWRAQHARLGQREAALKAQVEGLEAQLRDLTQRLYGKKSEQSAGSEALGKSQPANPRKRGQQPGSQGHGRSDRSILPVVVEVHDVSEAAKHCRNVARRWHRFQVSKRAISSKFRSRPTCGASSARATKRHVGVLRSQVL